MASKLNTGRSALSHRKPRWAGLLAGAIMAGLSGCSSIGTNTLSHDRFDYNNALADSWKEQLLLNIVKMRYGDTPMFLDVAQIISAYTLTTGLSINYLDPLNHPGRNVNFLESLGVGAKADFSDKPTVILKPQTDAQFVKALMTPLSPASVFFLLQAGYPADGVFNTTVDSVNGSKNWSRLGNQKRPADPEFLHILKLLSEAQAAGALDITINKTPKGEVPVISFRKESASAEAMNGVTELRKLLKLDPKASEYPIGFGIMADAKEPISLQTRSVFRIMLDLSSNVDVPKDDLKEKRAAPSISSQAGIGGTPLRIHSGEMNPWGDAFTAVEYHGHWFWVDDRDMASKRTFNLLMLFFALANQGSKMGDAMVTIPSGGGS
ncbi:MAG: hypothetical protein NTV43_09165 [Methylococcales bacterium]|nr:hypothetical protein [Methylococcales bacterium]